MGLAAILTLFAAPLYALDLAPPGARLTASEGPIADSVVLPRRPFEADRVVSGDSGLVTRRAYRLPGRSVTPLQIAAPIEAALAADGYELLFACSNADCGGFDFRFQLSLLPAPAMFVDLMDYRYALARKETPEGTRLVALVASRAGDAGMLHITEVAPLGTSPAEPALVNEEPAESPSPVAASGDFLAAMESAGHAVLTEIDFPSGAASLPEGHYASLTQLARWMDETPEARIVLVGHTDAVGSLEANTELSRRRAAAVAERIAALAPTAAARISASGAGYLAPVATNLTEDGRRANRRVEVVLLSR